MHNLVVAIGTLTDHGPTQGTALRPDLTGEEQPAVWEKRFKGVFTLSRSVGSSFKAPNLAVSFIVSLYIR